MRKLPHIRKVAPIVIATLMLMSPISSALAATPGSATLETVHPQNPDERIAAVTDGNTTLTASGGETMPGDTVTISFTLANTDPSPKAFILNVTSLPAGFTIMSHSDDGGVYRANGSRWLFQTIDPGNSTSPSLTLSAPNDVQGDFTVTAEAVTLDGVQGTATADIAVLGPPRANAGPDQITDSGDSVQLNATGSSDPNNDELRYNWSQVTGPSATIADAGSPTPTVTAPDVATETTLTYRVEVSDNNGGLDTDTVNITVQPLTQANFSADNLNAPVEATQGDSLTVSAEVSNDGEQAGTQTVEFRLDTNGSGTLESNEVLASQTVSLGAGETTEVVFEGLDTSPLAPGDYTHGVFTANDSETTTITISSPPEPANFSVTNLNAPTTGTQGDSLTVSAEVSNDGERAGTQTVQFRIDTNGDGTLGTSEVLASQEVSLDAGETTEITFDDLATDTLEPGDYTHGVFTANDSETTIITISSPAEPANFSVDNLTAPDTATQGDSITVSANISNAGDQVDTQAVQFRVDTDGNGTVEADETLASQEVSLDAGETTEVAFEDLDTSSLAPGDYTHGVFTANDSETATILIEAANQPPTADAGEDQTVDEQSTVQLDAGESTDPDGDIVTYNWTQISGPSVTLSETLFSAPTFTAPTVTEETTLTFQTRARDGDGGTDTDTVNITVQPVNDLPTADAGPDQTVDSGATVNLDASASTDPEGDTLAYEWESVSRANVTLSDANTATPSFTASDVDVETVLSFEVTVSDGDGGTDTDTVDIRIEPAEPPAENQPPVADAGANQTVSEESTVTLNASDSSDPDGDALTYTWTQTDGPNVTISEATTATPSFTAPEVEEATDITFEVTVSDGQGEAATDTVTTTVQPVTEREAFFAVTNLSVPDEVAQGESLILSATITNTGDAAGTQLIEARVDVNRDGMQEVIQTQSVTLDSGESTTVATTRTVPANLSTGTYTGGLFTFDSNQTTSVTVISSAPTEENYTRDEIAQAKYGLDFTELSNETARQVEELYLRQPFADGSQPEDVKTREEIAQERYGEDFENLSRETTIEIQSEFDAQFGDTGGDAEYTRDEISQAKYYGYNFSELSTETAKQVEELHNRQPFAGGLSPGDVQTREEIANQKYGLDVDELSRETRLEVEQTYHEQFNESDTE